MTQSIRIRLSTMMFLEYFIWGSWYVTMGTYLGKTLAFDGIQIGAAYGAAAIAAMISPFFVGLVADRFFATEKVLGAMHLLGAVLMYFASTAESFGSFYPLLLVYNLCYYPTIALTNSLSFHQMQDPGKEFPTIRVLGTIGWIVAGLVIGFMKVEAQNIPMQFAAATSVLMGLYAFTLPHTPPKAKGEKVGIREILGLDALSMLKKGPFLVLFVASILICIPLAFYYNFTNLYLNEIGFENAAGKMTLGQMSEVLFMLIMPLMFRRLGVKYMVLIGMAAWALRYVMFAFGGTEEMVWMLYAGILLHGICYDFFFVTGQIYADRKAPAHLKSSAQGLMTFATYGVGLFIGSYVSGQVVDMYSQGEAAHDWTSIWLVPAGLALMVLIGFFLLFNERRTEGGKE